MDTLALNKLFNYICAIVQQTIQKVKRNSEIRDIIVESAQIVFEKYSFSRTTMELIAQEAGKGKSTLYYYFKNKEEVFIAVVEKEWSILQGEILKVIDSGKDTKTIFKEFSLKRFRLSDQVTNYLDLVKGEFPKQYVLIGNTKKKYKEQEIFAVKQILLKGILNKELRISEQEVDEIALSIAVTVNGLIDSHFVSKDQQTSLEDRLDILLKLLFYGLLK